MTKQDFHGFLNALMSKIGVSDNGMAGWVLQVFVVVLAVMVFNYVLSVTLQRLARRVEESTNPWDDAAVRALRKPLRWLVWIVGIAFAAEIVRDNTGAAIFEAIDPIRSVGVIATLAWFLTRLVNNLEIAYVNRAAQREEQIDRVTLEALAKLVRISIVITAALVALQTLGFSISGVLAFGGIGGIAIGFAAKDLLANFFGGLMIYLDRPFAVGDWIYSPDKDIEGTVEQIGWRLTRIRSFSRRPIYVPNSVFTGIAVVNPSRMTNRRIKLTVGIRYEDISKMRPIVDDVTRMLREHPDIDQNQTLFVTFTTFNDSSVDFLVYTFTKTTKWVPFQKIQQDVLLKIADIIAEHGAEIAFPTRTLSVPEGIAVSADRSTRAFTAPADRT